MPVTRAPRDAQSGSRPQGFPVDVSSEEKVEERILLGGKPLQPLTNELCGARTVLLLAVDLGLEESLDLVLDVVWQFDLPVDVGPML
jgi:hypothetical protein